MEEELWAALRAWITDEHKGAVVNVEWKTVPGAGRGLFMKEDLGEDEVLLGVPITALLNPVTLLASSTHLPPSLFMVQPPVKNGKRKKVVKASSSQKSSSTSSSTKIPLPLTSTALLTLHLALTKDPHNRHPSAWKPYIDALPQDFRPWHPLSWVVEPGIDGTAASKQDWGWWNALSERGMTYGAKKKLREIRERWDLDYAILKLVLCEMEPFKSQGIFEIVNTEALLWGWLNVNTRSISVELGLPPPHHLNNHTLCPILDIANHSSDKDMIISSPRSALSLTNNGPKVQGFEMMTRRGGMKQDDEVLFEYGRHSPATLCAEYGFIEDVGPDGMGGRLGEVDIGWWVEELWQSLPEEERQWKEEILMNEGYSGDYTLHNQPSPPHPSYRVQVMLRCFHLPPSKETNATLLFLQTLTGQQETVNSKNEVNVRKSLVDVTLAIEQSSSETLSALETISLEEPKTSDLGDCRKNATVMLRNICQLEAAIARGVRGSVEAGVIF